MRTNISGFPPRPTGAALILGSYFGSRFDQISDLRYANYRWARVEAPYPPTKLEFVVDYDLNDQLVGAQGRIVYDPSKNGGFTVAEGSWQTWDAKAGKWWGTLATVQRGGQNVSNPCVITTPCTWSELLAAFPNIGVHSLNGAILFEAPPGGSNAIHSNVDNLVVGLNGSITTFDFEAASAVPLVAPDTVPHPLWDSLTSTPNLVQLGSPVIRDIISLQFRPTATLVERRNAIALVQGAVIGGTGWGDPEHAYLVRIPYSLSAGDSATGPLLRAVFTLRPLSSVQYATPVYTTSVVAPNYLKPTDGPGYRSWPLSRDSANGPNWGQIALSAPQAWGCTTGAPSVRPSVKIGIVDQGFYDVDDLHANIGAIHEFDTGVDSTGHGTAVAGIVGAVGNNNIGITGMLWNARLDLYDWHMPVPGAATTDARNAANVIRAVQQGERIVNLSWGIDDRRLADVPNSMDSLRLEFFAQIYEPVFKAAVDPVTGKSKTLFVISAGNATKGLFPGMIHSHLDTYWNGWGKIKKDFPQYAPSMIIVGASRQLSQSSQELAPFSFGGKLVDVAAPGARIATLGRTGTVLVDGTSIAAPFVTGIAGMLMTFDPSLEPDSVKKLILAGTHSRASDIPFGRTVRDDAGNYLPIPDAFESLKLAALRTGGPLCGDQHVWSDSGAIYVQRTAFGPTERLFSTIPYFVFDIDVMHGGHDISFGITNSFFQFGFLSGSWQSGYYDPDATPSGAYQSRHGLSHDGTAGISADFGDISATTERASFVFYDAVAGRTDSVHVDFRLGPLGPSMGGIQRATNQITSVVAAYPQQGDTALLVVNRIRAGTTDSLFACVDDRSIPTLCHFVRYVWIPDTAFVYKTSVRTPSLIPIHKYADTSVFWIDLSETDTGSVSAMGTVVDTVSTGVSGRVIVSCSTRYMDNRLGGMIRPSGSESFQACNYPNGGGSSTFSPSRIPSSGIATLATTTRGVPTPYRTRPRIRPTPMHRTGEPRRTRAVGH